MLFIVFNCIITSDYCVMIHVENYMHVGCAVSDQYPILPKYFLGVCIVFHFYFGTYTTLKEMFCVTKTQNLVIQISVFLLIVTFVGYTRLLWSDESLCDTKAI